MKLRRVAAAVDSPLIAVTPITSAPILRSNSEKSSTAALTRGDKPVRGISHRSAIGSVPAKQAQEHLGQAEQHGQTPNVRSWREVCTIALYKLSRISALCLFSVWSSDTDMREWA
jgi:hypothetical protein